MSAVEGRADAKIQVGALLRRHLPTLVLLGVIALMLLVRIDTMVAPDASGDASGKWWFTRKAMHGHMVHADGGGFWSHHMTRAGVNVPGGLLQLVFGPTGPGYYVPGLMASLVLVAYVFKLGSRWAGPLAGLLAAGWITFFPAMDHAGSQYMPDVFSAAYLAAAAYYLSELCLLRSDLGKRHIVLLSLSLLGAYLSKEPNTFFFPGIFAAVWFLSPKRLRLKRLVWLAGLLLCGYLIETAWYALNTKYYLGRIQIVGGSYGDSGRLKRVTFFGLFERFTGLPDAWKFTFYAFFLSTPLARFIKHRGIWAVQLATYSFLFCITFYVRSIDPLVQGTLYHPRYLLVALPLAMTVVVAFAVRLLRAGAARVGALRPWIARSTHTRRWTVALLVLLVTIALSRRDAKAENYLERTEEWETLLNDAYSSGTPIVAASNVKRGRQERVLRITGQVMLRDEFVFDETGAPALPPDERIEVGGKDYLYLANPRHDEEAVERAIKRRCAIVVTISSGLYRVSKPTLRASCRGK